MDYDLLVIGGGPAGYAGAIRAAQLGAKVGCVEKERAGGTCLNWGCIPTKSLLRNAELYQTLTHDAEAFGLSFKDLSYDWDAVIKRSRKVSDKLAGGIEYLFKKNKIDYLRGKGSIAGENKVKVEAEDGSAKDYSAKHILIATGCVSRQLPFLPFNGETVVGSRDAMVLAKQPKSMLIIGAGAIGCEFAYFFNAYGTEVTLVEMMPNILPVEDEEVSQTVAKSFKKQGIEIKTEVKVTDAKANKQGVKGTLESKDGKKTEFEVDVVLVAVGVAPLMPGGKEPEKDDRGYIRTDENYQTSIPGVYAAGDIIGPPWLAHVATWEALQVVEYLISGTKPKKVDVFPGCTYCLPQVASVGLTEKAAKEQGLEIRVGKFPFAASGKALASGHAEGFAKVITGAKYGEILGAHIVGHEATELIAEMTLALEMEATYEEIESTIHAHPTLSEAIHEAVGDAYGHAIHI